MGAHFIHCNKENPLFNDIIMDKWQTFQEFFSKVYLTCLCSGVFRMNKSILSVQSSVENSSTNFSTKKAIWLYNHMHDCWKFFKGLWHYFSFPIVLSGEETMISQSSYSPHLNHIHIVIINGIINENKCYSNLN